MITSDYLYLKAQFFVNTRMHQMYVLCINNLLMYIGILNHSLIFYQIYPNRLQLLPRQKSFNKKLNFIQHDSQMTNNLKI